MNAIMSLDEEIVAEELWNTESLSFRYFNHFQEFKHSFNAEVEWLQDVKKEGILNDYKIQKIENKKGIIFAKWINQLAKEAITYNS